MIAKRSVTLTEILAVAGVTGAVLCALAGLGTGLGYRFGWWGFRAGIAALPYVFWAAIATAALCMIVALVSAARALRPQLVMGLTGLAIAVTCAWIPFNLRMKASTVPRIHDITTDVANPPQFVRVAALRKSGEHPVAYDGPQVAEQQHKAYPDIGPLVLNAPRDKVFASARDTLAAMGLEIVDADPAQGRIEATATTLLFGFKDDVVVRITDDATTTKVDVRSKSRVGANDFGVNARRIRTFETRLKAAVSTAS